MNAVTADMVRDLENASVLVVGAGGGGAGASSLYAAGGGGGGGSYTPINGNKNGGNGANGRVIIKYPIFD